MKKQIGINEKRVDDGLSHLDDELGILTSPSPSWLLHTKKSGWTLWVSIIILIFAAVISVLSLINLQYSKEQMRIQIEKAWSNK